METFYRDLAEFGLPFVTPDKPEFSAFAREIRDRLPAYPVEIFGDPGGAAVLLNESGKTILSLSVTVRMRTAAGRGRTTNCSSLFSGRTMAVVAGDGGPGHEDRNLILPGSKRLITDRGVFGDNYDVVARPAAGGRGIGFGSGGGGGSKVEEFTSRHVQIDLAIFEGGACAGPDENGMFLFLVEDLERRRDAASELLASIRQGVTREEIYHRLEPLGERWAVTRPGRFNLILRPFAKQVSRLVAGREDDKLVAYLEEIAKPRKVRLRRV